MVVMVMTFVGSIIGGGGGGGGGVVGVVVGGGVVALRTCPSRHGIEWHGETRKRALVTEPVPHLTSPHLTDLRTAPHRTPHRTTLRCTVHHTTLRCNALQRAALWIAKHCTALHCTAPHIVSVHTNVCTLSTMATTLLPFSSISIMLMSMSTNMHAFMRADLPLRLSRYGRESG